MNSELSWDEFRLVKSIADARSLAGAAERLGVNQSTVFRRLAAVEAAVGARLFDRSRAGYEPTDAGEDMIALAATMAESIIEFERRVAGRDVKLTGELSVTVPIGIGLHFMPAIVAEFQASNPGVVVELILANEALDLSRRGAAALLPRRSKPGPHPGRLPAAGTRRWLMDADPRRSSPGGASARVHGFRRRRAHETSPRHRGRGTVRDRLNPRMAAAFTRSRTSPRPA